MPMPHIRLIDQPPGGLPPLPRRQGTATPLCPPFVRDADLCTRALQLIAEMTTCDGKPPSFRRLQARLGLSADRPLHESLDDLVRTNRVRRLAGGRFAIMASEHRPPSGSA